MHVLFDKFVKAYSAASLLCDNEYFDHPKLVSTAVDTTDENVHTRVGLCLQQVYCLF